VRGRKRECRSVEYRWSLRGFLLYLVREKTADAFSVAVLLVPKPSYEQYFQLRQANYA
jgi:hypothetical protein